MRGPTQRMDGETAIRVVKVTTPRSRLPRRAVTTKPRSCTAAAAAFAGMLLGRYSRK